MEELQADDLLAEHRLPGSVLADQGMNLCVLLAKAERPESFCSGRGYLTEAGPALPECPSHHKGEPLEDDLARRGVFENSGIGPRRLVLTQKHDKQFETSQIAADPSNQPPFRLSSTPGRLSLANAKYGKIPIQAEFSWRSGCIGRMTADDCSIQARSVKCEVTCLPASSLRRSTTVSAINYTR
jgi:hypothetical protein